MGCGPFLPPGGSIQMTFRVSRPASPNLLRQGALLGLVLVLHVALLLLLTQAREHARERVEIPLMVDFIEPPAAGMKEPQALPFPKSVARPAEVRKTPPARSHKPPAPTSLLETTSSNDPATDTVPVATAVASPPSSNEGHTGGTPGNAPGTSGGGEGTLVQARFDADYLKNPAPPYPPQSRRLGEEGKVILRVRVSPEGMAEQVEIRTSSGSSRLDDSALRTVRSWKFIPARRGNTAVESWVLVPIIFKLEQ